MTPYYDKDGITIYHGDCRDILPSLEPVDLVLTDPPYGIGEAAGKNKSRGALATAKDYGNDAWDDAPITQDLMACVLAAGSTQIIFGGNYYDLPPTSCWLIWDKENGGNDFADCEMAWTNMSKAARLLRWRWHGMLQGDMKAKEYRYHPTQKPVPVMRWCLEQAGSAMTILDPFMGSGTTLRAAKDLGRKAIGIEIEERYCEIAAQRLAQEVLGLT
jgi:DNA modification methylase